MGTKFCVLIAKLVIAVWRRPGKIYIYITEEMWALYDYIICRLAPLANY